MLLDGQLVEPLVCLPEDLLVDLEEELLAGL